MNSYGFFTSQTIRWSKLTQNKRLKTKIYDVERTLFDLEHVYSFELVFCLTSQFVNPFEIFVCIRVLRNKLRENGFAEKALCDKTIKTGELPATPREEFCVCMSFEKTKLWIFFMFK